jgi:hypothetical protein
MAEHVSSLLRRSVGHLEDEVPESYRLVLEVLGPLVVEVDVDGELFSLRGGRRLEVLDGPAGVAGARFASSRAAILALLAYVHAAVRAPSHPELLAALRTGPL